MKSSNTSSVSLVKRFVILLLVGYKRLLSPYLGNACRFHPSCSEYTMEAVSKKGVLRGLMMGVWRILRCNPYNRGGHDPVR